MSKNKLTKFKEMESFPNVIQPHIKDVLWKDYYLKGRWNKDIFKNNNPIVLELGCGKGEYSIGLALRYPEKNFIGIDIKGARIWKGAKYALEKNITNVRFLRTRIDFIQNFFAENEVSEIWIPHPDPQRKKPNKRLTSAYFLSLYQSFVIDKAFINLKTDSYNLFQYTLKVAETNSLEIVESYEDIHSANLENEITQIRTFYEQMFLEEGSKITFLKFRLDKNKKLQNPPKIEIIGYKY